MSVRTFDLRKYKNLDIADVTMRSVNGNDTIDSAARCIPPNGAPIDGNVFVLLMRQQMIAQSIVSFTGHDGARVTSQGPCLESVMWNARTREFVGEIFDHMNGVSGDEREGFRKALMTEDATHGSSDTVSAE